MSGRRSDEDRRQSVLSRAASTLRHPISQNAIAVYAVQIVLTLLPLITLPWIARALRPAEVGILLFTQSFSFFVGIVIEYGFGLSATRRIAQERDDPRAVAATVSAVQGAKLLLIGVATVAALVALFVVPEFRDDPSLVAFGWGMAALAGLNPFWYFLGVERVRLVASIDVTVRVLIAAAIVLLVRDEGQGDRVLWIWTIGNALSTAALTTMMYRRVHRRRPARGGPVAALKTGWPLFLGTASISLYTSGTIFMLGLVTGSVELAMFAAAERIARVAIRAIAPVSSVVYPRVSNLLAGGRTDRAQQLSSGVLALVTLVAGTTTVLLYVSAPAAVGLLFGERYEQSIGLIRVLSLVLPGVAVSTTVSALWLLARGMDGLSTRILITGGLLNLVLTPLVGLIIGPLGVAWLLVGLETGVAVAFVLVVRAKRLSPTWAQVVGRP